MKTNLMNKEQSVANYLLQMSVSLLYLLTNKNALNLPIKMLIRIKYLHNKNKPDEPV